MMGYVLDQSRCFTNVIRLVIASFTFQVFSIFT